MAGKLAIDNGILEFEVNGGELLRFNPSDPNVYHRFSELAVELPKLEEDFRKQAETLDEKDAAGMLALMNAFDRALKEKLAQVFGEENDFDRILGGVNLLAVGRNGQRLISNVLESLQPLLEEGVKRHRQHAAAEAVAEAKARRTSRAK